MLDQKEIGSPTFKQEIFNVIVKGVPTFLKKGKEQVSPFGGILWLVSILILAIPTLYVDTSLTG